MKINQNRLIHTFTKLVSIDSPSRRERRMADFLSAELRKIGFAVFEDDAGRKLGGDSGNLYAKWTAERRLPPLLFCAHMDTVRPAVGKQAVVDPCGTVRSAGDTVLGADDLSAVASILEALRTVYESGARHRNIELLLTVSEETYCAGSAVFDFSNIAAKEAYVLDYEGAMGQAVIAGPTIFRFKAEIAGKAAHAGFAPEQGVDAVAAAARAVSRIKTGRVTSALTLNIGRIDGGLLTNIVPDHCTVEGEIRSSSHAAALAQAERVRKEFQTACDALHARLIFSNDCLMQAYEISEDSPVLQRYFAVCRKRGYQTESVRTFGGSDNNILAANGIDGVVIASAMHACHSCAEHTSIRELTQLSEIVLDLMLDTEV